MEEKHNLGDINPMLLGELDVDPSSWVKTTRVRSLEASGKKVNGFEYVTHAMQSPRKSS